MGIDKIVGNAAYDIKVKPYLEKITMMRFLGNSQATVAKALDVNPHTFSAWLHKYPDLYDAWRAGESQIAEKLLNTTLQKAYGYKYEETREEVTYDPDGNITSKKIIKSEKFAHPDASTLERCCKAMEPERWVDHKAEDKDIEITLSNDLLEYSE